MSNRKLKISAILSYVLIGVNSIYGIVIIPFILGVLGPSEYGVYRTISSFTAALVVLDLGIGNTVLRYIAKFNAEKNQKQIENFSAMSIIQALVISIVITSISIVLYQLIDVTFSNKMTAAQVIKAKQLFVIIIITMCCRVFENVIAGIINGCNQFAFTNFVKLSMLIIRIILVVILLTIYTNSLMLVIIDFIITILAIIAELFYVYRILLVRIKYYFWDKLLFIESFKYTILLFIQSIVMQLNGNFDNIIIGALIGPLAVTIYSLGLTIFNMFEQFSMALSSIMLPTVMNQIHAGASNTELENTVIKVGRFQFALLGAIVAGFAVIGREFVHLWLGKDYSNVWVIAMILMLPALLPLIQNVCLSIIRAKNKIAFRTMVISIMAVFNLIVTIFGVMYFGYIAAAVGTAIGLTGANLIAMNIYYYKRLNINVFRIFRNIFKGIAPCILISTIPLIVANHYIQGNWLAFSIKVMIFMVVYGILISLFGFNSYEKAQLRIDKLIGI